MEGLALYGSESRPLLFLFSYYIHKSGVIRDDFQSRRAVVPRGPFVYVRWLSDRYGIDKVTNTWNETVIDRRVVLTIMSSN